MRWAAPRTSSFGAVRLLGALPAGGTPTADSNAPKINPFPMIDAHWINASAASATQFLKNLVRFEASTWHMTCTWKAPHGSAAKTPHPLRGRQHKGQTRQNLYSDKLRTLVVAVVTNQLPSSKQRKRSSSLLGGDEDHQPQPSVESSRRCAASGHWYPNGDGVRREHYTPSSRSSR
jgi:hypothetical protein